MRDLDLLEYLAHRNRQAAVAALPDLFRTPATVLRHHRGGNLNGHVALGKRIGINEHHMVASKVHIFEIGAGKRTVRQLLDFGIKGQS